MNSSTRLTSVLMITVLGFSSAAAFAAESDNEMQTSNISMTATLEEVVCRQCFHWKGTGGIERVADKLTVTISTPIQFAGKRIKLFVWNDGGETLQSWQSGEQLSFSALEEQVDRERAVIPYSYVAFNSK